MTITLHAKREIYGDALTNLNNDIKFHLGYDPQFAVTWMQDTKVLFAEGLKFKKKDINWLMGFIAGKDLPFEVQIY